MTKQFSAKRQIKAFTLVFFLFLGLFTENYLWAQIRIMPLGDSITRGIVGSPDEIGYRRLLYLDLINSGYDVNFVGYRPDGFLLDFDRDHEGHGGFLTQEIALNVEGYLDINPADIILLHIGTNDVDLFSTEDPTQVEAILNAIDNWESVPGNNKVVVIVAKIINQQGHLCLNDSVTTRFNNNVEAMALNRIADRIFIVDIECSAGFDYNFDMVDLIHPNQVGYDKMAAKWFADGLVVILPVADASSDLNVTEGEPVQLDGSTSHVPQVPNVNFLVMWDQIAGPIVEIVNPNSLTPTLTAPQVDANGTVLQFQLTISDIDNANLSDADIVSVNVNDNSTPVATLLKFLTTGDLNGDGRDDLAGVMASGSIWYSTNLTTWVNIPGDLQTIVTGDFDGDGNDDLAGVNSVGRVWYSLDLSSWVNIPGMVETIVAGDFDGDGDDDIAGINPNGVIAKVFYTPNLSTWTPIPGLITSITTGDFDGDGDDDIAGINPNGVIAKVFYTTNLSTWTPIPGLITSITTGDFDGDGYDDIAGINPDGVISKIFYTTDLSTWTPIPGLITSIVAGDFDGDKDDDIAGINPNGVISKIFYTTDLVNWTTVPGELDMITTGDFDADGLDDLAGVNSIGKTFYTTDLANWTYIP